MAYNTWRLITMFKQSLVPLDRVYRPDGKEVLILDVKIVVHNMLLNYRPGLEVLRWKIYFNSVAHKIKPQGLIIVDDQRDAEFKYWRHYELEALGLPEYKGCRKVTTEGGKRPEGWTRTLKALDKVIEEYNIDYFKAPGIEADDWASLAAKAARYLRTNNTVVLVSYDADWQQLVNDQFKILIYNNGPFNKHSALMDASEVLVAFRAKDIQLYSPKEIIEYKMRFGDAGDNLYPGAPRSVIDLIDNPCPLFKWQDYASITMAINNPTFKPCPITALQLEQQLNRFLFNQSVV